MNKLIFLLIFIILIFFGCNVNIKEKVNNCDKISTNFERDRCYLMLADGFVTDNQKQEICKNILNEGTKENCYNIFGIEYQKKAIESNFPIEYVNQSKDYLISKFGGKIFNESIKFERAYSEDDFIYSGECNIQISKAKYGKKYIVEYSFDQSKYIDYPDEFDIFYYPIIVAYDADLGKVYCTDNVVDCINYPTYCPPYKINSYEGAINTFKVKCRDDFTYVGF